MASKWELKGSYFEACNCNVSCPCIFLSDPTHGSCTVLVAWHIEQGNLDKTALNGLNAVLAAHSPGNMLKTKWDVALYIDSKANDAQRAALQRILSGQEGGTFAALAPLMGKVVGVRSVPIEYRLDGKNRSLRIPQVAEATVNGIEGPGGSQATISGPLMALAPVLTVARAEKVSFRDHGWNWEFAGQNGFFAPISMRGP